ARTYRSWTLAPPAARAVSDAAVVVSIRSRRVGAQGRATPVSLYGRRATTAMLRRPRLVVARCTVHRRTRARCWNRRRRGRAHRTTVRAKDGVRAGDLLNRVFRAPAPNRVWVADFTYVRTWAGFAYVAFVVDVFAQRIIGWHAMSTRPTDL